ncbi:hypothetical protein S40285_02950 [Stachybotrys chlorohalonatus IBT 40285]|uniref:Zn(2)-C6 fungal-type domain-containing protein n=1 Tax=Stachybotrys chlorohalonatus (strain IBT 40285) TaxID=1283841 RepID=A0A084QK26_STAC4|nr:hypothetical protein S40285_02950 [Stachybotrys chlorohalonata IBT 40285]
MEPDAGFKVFSIHSDDQKVRGYKRRKEHRKTKLGCLACRAKRVKCDETRPVCLRCSRNNRECVYEHADDGSESDASRAPGEASGSMIPSLSPPTMGSPSMQEPDNGTPAAQLMEHLLQNQADIFQMPGRDIIIRLSRSDPLIHNVLLALAACHLRQREPGVVQHRIAEHFQQSVALRDLQRALDTPREALGQDGINSMLLSAILLSQITFALTASETLDDQNLDPGTSWVFSEQEDRLGWLSLQIGLNPLVLSVAPYGDETMSFLASIFSDPGQNWWDLQANDDIREMPFTWARILRINGELDLTLRSQASALLELRDAEPSNANVFIIRRFLRDLPPDLRHLLYVRDERAMWMFGYWLGLVSRFNGVWWTRQRARRDHRAICIWLAQQNLSARPGAEGQLWTEMLRELEQAPTYTPRR